MIIGIWQIIPVVVHNEILLSQTLFLLVIVDVERLAQRFLQILVLTLLLLTVFV